MFGRIWNFVKRHRRKFLITGIVVGGAIVLGKYAKKRLLEYQATEAAECFAYVRRQHHFDSNQRTCNTTVLSMLPMLKEALCKKLDSEALTEQLRNKPANKLEIWEELKIKSFTRTLVAVYSCCMLVVYLRVQLNILGGYIYRDSVVNRDQDQMCEPVVATESIRKQYLASIQYLLEEGLDKLISSVECSVRSCLDQYSLKDSLSSQTIRDVISKVRCKVENVGSTPACGTSEPRLGVCNVSCLQQYLVSAEDHHLLQQACHITREERILATLQNETLDMIQSPDFHVVMTTCLDTGFSHLVTRVEEYLQADSLNGLTNHSTGNGGAGMPVAKLIPLMNGLVYSVVSDSPNPLLQELLLKDEMKNFAANVYDAFCETHDERLTVR